MAVVAWGQQQEWIKCGDTVKGEIKSKQMSKREGEARKGLVE